ncbi:serine hydrolase FSH [Aspergillus unguis]
MHFLCLHGTGTTSKILEIQTAALRYELGDGHTFDFAEGSFRISLDPELQEIAPNEDSGFSYFDLDRTKTTLQSVDDLETFIEEEGPFDGVLAFSQGIIVATTLLLRCVRQKREMPFKCALFFSPRLGPMDEDVYSKTGEVKEVDFETVRQAVRIPVALIWGCRDQDAGKAREIQKIFWQERLACYVHDGGHVVPGVGNQGDLLGSVNIVRRVIGWVEGDS